MKKRILSLLLAAIILVSLVTTAYAAASTDYTLTGDQAEDVLIVAKAQLGKTGTDLGYTADWCSWFASWAGRTAGASFPAKKDSGTGRTTTNWFVNNAKGTFYYFRDANYKHLLKQNPKLKNLDLCVKSDRSSFTPQKGDLIMYLWKKSEAEGYNWSHVGIVESFSNGKVKTIEGNVGGKGYAANKVTECTRDFSNNTEVVGIVRPNYTGSGPKTLTINYNANGGTVVSDRFSMASDGTIYDGSSKAANKWNQGVGSPEYGLWNNTSFGLSRDGYSFVGWCRNKDGSGGIFDQDDTKLIADNIYPDISKGSASVTLYAHWAKNDFVSVPEGVYTLEPKHAPGMRLDVYGASAEDNANVQIYTANGSVAQQFRFTQKDGCYIITAMCSGKALDVANGSRTSQTNIQQYGDTGNNQKWYLSDAGNGYYYIRPYINPGMCMEAAGARTDDYTNVRTFMIHNHDAQKWKLEMVENDPEPEPTIPEVHFPRVNVYRQGQFTDVKANHWFEPTVASAFEMGLVRGNSDTTYNPYGDVTLAEAITMAARIHSIYNTGEENFVQTGTWYQVYLDYAYDNDIISAAYYNSDVSQNATRAQFAEIFANAMDYYGLYPINSVADNSIPDVKMSAKYSDSVYELYRAGILTGNDSLGTFAPDTNITRAEAATILARMGESDNRVEFTMD